MKRDDVETHSSHIHGPQYPAINVKAYKWPSPEDVMDRFKCTDPTAERALGFAFDMAQENFWQDAKALAADIFWRDTKVYSAGRSGGWLIVVGLKDISEWNLQDLNLWAKFQKHIKIAVKWYTSKEQVLSDIEANRWAEEGSEAYNYIDEHDGSKCIVDLKKQAKEAGFGSVVR